MELERLIRGRTLGLVYAPPDYAVPRTGLRSLWRRHLVANAAVRDRGYMEAVFRSHFPRCDIVEATEGRIPAEAMENADTLVLLFPDPIGMDFGWIEREIASRWPTRSVVALNGRRRFFRIDPQMRRRLALRRFLASYRIPEIGLFVMFVVATPILLLIDLVRGRR